MKASQAYTGVATGASASAMMGEVRFMAMSPRLPGRSSVGRDSEDRSVTPTHPETPRGTERQVLVLGANEGFTPGAEVRDSCDWDPHFMILVFQSGLWEWVLFLALLNAHPYNKLKVPPKQASSGLHTHTHTHTHTHLAEYSWG